MIFSVVQARNMTNSELVRYSDAPAVRDEIIRRFPLVHEELRERIKDLEEELGWLKP